MIAFAVDWWMQSRQQSQFSARAVAYVPRPSRGFDFAMLVFCAIVCILMLAVLGMAIYTSFIKLWPYDKSFSLRHYGFGLIDGGVIDSYFNSLRMALLTALVGTVLIFGGAYLLEKTRGLRAGAHGDALSRVDSDGGAGHGAGPGLHLFLQRAIQPAEYSLRHA